MDPKGTYKKEAKVIYLPSASEQPADYAISMVVQNLFATYGEDKVRASMKELFGMKSKAKAKAA